MQRWAYGRFFFVLILIEVVPGEGTLISAKAWLGCSEVSVREAWSALKLMLGTSTILPGTCTKWVPLEGR